MPNTNAPFGLRPIGLNNSPATPSFSLETRKIAPGDTQAARRGDVMRSLATGYITTSITAPFSGVDLVIGNLAGVFWGCEYLSIAQGRPVFSTTWPGGDASGDVIAQIIPLQGTGTNQQFIVQGLSTPFTFADVGASVNMSYAAGTSFSAYSKSGLTATGPAATALPFKITGLWSDYERQGQPGTDNTSNFNWIIVAFNAAAELAI